jgi:acetyltransferase-like isoleucine patch superfamily enzyme
VHVARHSLGEPKPTVIGNNVTIGASCVCRPFGWEFETFLHVYCDDRADDSCAHICCATAGHGACIHACTIEDDVLIGMGALVLDGAKVRCNSKLAAQLLLLRKQCTVYVSTRSASVLC